MRWLAGLAFPAIALAAVPLPKVTGPIPSTAKPGDPSHNYPFFSMQEETTRRDYVEEEFYVEGTAAAYTVDGQPVDSGGKHPYKTRVIVRRPKSPGKFNGTVLVEWMNVTGTNDKELDWIWSHEHLMRRGFAHVGVSAQAAGIDQATGLKAWNPARYGSLDVTAHGVFKNDELSFSIFSQVAQAAKSSKGGLLGSLTPRNVIATGQSQSAGRLVTYYNAIHPVEPVFDGFVLHGPVNSGKLRTDIRTPAWKLLAETDVLQRQAAVRQPDTDYVRTWEVAGASHGDWDLSVVLTRLWARDMNRRDGPAPCERPVLSRVPAHLVQDSVYDWMKRWVENGTQPPHAPPITMETISLEQGVRSVVARDENGNALGGIRLAQVAVPTATNTGLNNGEPLACRISGSYEPFDPAKLARLYPSHAKYVAEVERITNENMKAGFITKEGAEQTKREAAQSKVGAQGR